MCTVRDAPSTTFKSDSSTNAVLAVCMDIPYIIGCVKNDLFPSACGDIYSFWLGSESSEKGHFSRSINLALKSSSKMRFRLISRHDLGGTFILYGL